jgi:hypothetical protein
MLFFQRLVHLMFFVMYMPHKKHVNDVTISPFRTETNPLFLIGNRNGGLSFIDFGDTSKKRRLFYIYKNVVQS